MSYAFVFDASACSGCKACQVACKDRHDLPVGVLWRRVYEISGGAWQKQGDAWTNSVFAYNLSLACNHCVHTKSAGVCPTDAYTVRPDGIVRIDALRCMGCGYCAWACPYDAPQLNWCSGVMTKCDLCCEDLDQGLPPACVAACPMRCLDLQPIEESEPATARMGLWLTPGEQHPFPLPKNSRTEPHLTILPHPATGAAEADGVIRNREEVSPKHKSSPLRELPLLIFSLAGQAAIGLCAALTCLVFILGDPGLIARLFRLPLVGGSLTIGLALAVSFFHLGRPQNAWRVLANLRKSWLSREVLALLAFCAAWILFSVVICVGFGSLLLWRGLALLALIPALTFLTAMQSIYRLRSVPGWEPRKTSLEFTLSAWLLGSLLAAMLLPAGDGDHLHPALLLASLPAFMASLLLSLTPAVPITGLRLVRLILLLTGSVGALLLAIGSAPALTTGSLLVFLAALAAEGIGRWAFYARRKPGI